MGSEKIFMFGEPSTGGRADLTAILPALMNNNKGIDPSILAMLGNRDGNGRDGFGNDFFAILLLFILMGWGGNNNGGFFGNRGNGGGEGLNILNNDSTRELLMSAIQGNGNAISQLSTQLGCTTGQIQDGINTLNMSLCNVGNQVGMSGQQVINAIMRNSNDILNSVEKHKSILEDCENIVKDLNPVLAVDKSRDEKIANLEATVGKIKGSIEDLKELILGLNKKE